MADDYRHANRADQATKIRATAPEPARQTAAIAWLAELDLPVCAIDLRGPPGGNLYCFEVNPSPGFTYYHSESGKTIAEAVAQLLATALMVRERRPCRNNRASAGAS